MLKRVYSMVFLCAVASACMQAPVGGTDPGGGPGSSIIPAGQQGDWAAIVKLEDEAKSITKVAGCASSECRAVPVGSRACGGPRYYIPYCAKTTDSVALYRKLDEVAKAEQAYNVKYKIASTCEFRMPPSVEAVAGSCVTK